MNEELEVLKIVTLRLGKAGIPYMICGSVAANYYSIPRMTRDIDIVIELQKKDVDEFFNLFRDDFYIDRQTVLREVSRQGMFNLIHNQYVVKVDFIIGKSSEYQKAGFARRRQVVIEQMPMWFASAEDLVISKLLWAKSSRSEMQLKDVRNLIKTVEGLDLNYIDNWVRKLDLEDLYNKVIQ